ncbi:MAG: bifunctional diguanylate cyclase/phosphodiesterase [Oscillospiraceae bacterium]|nr:bifunctional diguanylate cyclase/phosphodiesterase [Oscillospiraceae bacterium]
MSEFIDTLKRFRCVGVCIDITKDLPVVVNKEYQTGKKSITANLIDLINAEDLTVVLTRIDEITMEGAGSLRLTCRFVPENKQYLICCEMRREKRLGKTLDYLFGVIMDVAEFNKSMDSDPMQQELIKKKLNKFSPSDSASCDTGISGIIGKEYLSRIQSPLGNDYGLKTAIFTECGQFICSADPAQTELDIRSYKHSRQIYIKINHVIYAVWIIASNDSALIERHSPIHAILAENLSKIANSYVMLYNEMVNTEHANKLLSETIEQQMLLNGIYSKVLNERNSVETIQSVVNLTGEFLKLERVIVYEDVPENEEYRSVYEWLPAVECDAENPEVAKSPKQFRYTDYPELVEELNAYETYFSNNPEHNVLGLDFSSYVASNLNGDGSKYGIILYVVNDPLRILTHAEKRLLRSVSQIVAAVSMRCRDNEKLDATNERLYQLAYRDQKLGFKNKASLGLDISEALESGKQGAIVAFKISNIKYIGNFEGQDYADRLLAEILDSVSKFQNSAEPYRFSDNVFMVLMRDTDVAGVKDFCDVLVNRFHEPWSVGGRENYLGITTGVALYPNAGVTADELYRAAEISIDKAKEFGVNSYAFYSGEFEPRRNEDYHCAQILRDAVENDMGGVDVQYFPVYSNQKEYKKGDERKIVSYEAVPVISKQLNPELYPSRVIMEIAEKMGIDVTIDRWLIKQACEFCKKARIKNREMTVSVSVCARSLITGEVVTMIKDALKETKLPAAGLAIQFSERIVAINYDRFISVLSVLKKTGVSVILDNLGSYYAAGTLLRHSGINALKADITVFESGIDEFSESYVSGLINLAKTNGVSIGVRSIENESRLEGIVQGADWYQGGFYSTPVNEETAIRLV